MRALLVSGFAVLGLPQVLWKYVLGLPVPIQTIGAFIIVVVCSLWATMALAEKRLRLVGRTTLLLVFVLIYMAVIGFLNRGHRTFLLHFYYRELLFLGIALAGVALAASANTKFLIKITLDLLAAGLLLLVVFSMLLWLGYIGDARGRSAERIVDPSMYVYVYGVLITFPVVLRNAPLSNRGVIWICALMAFAVGMFTAMSATRSLVFQAGISLIAGMIYAARRLQWRPRTVLALTIMSGIALTMALRTTGVGVLSRRLSETELRGETRIIELREMIEDFRAWFPFGTGIGVGFETVVGRESSDDRFGGLVNAPHIGILAWPIKAGIWGGGLMLLYLFAAIGSLLERRRTLRLTINFHSAFPVLVAIACTSGGWTLLELFLTGLFFAGGRRLAQDPTRLVAER